MPYKDKSEIPNSLKGIDPPITLEQANEIAHNAEAIEKRLSPGSKSNPWAIAIWQFKTVTHAKSSDGKGWVRKERHSEMTIQDDGDLSEAQRPMIGSPGGKKFLAEKIVSLMPEHKTYCEPMVGGGAVFWKRDKDENRTEALNDIDKDLMACYRFFQGASDEDLKALKEKNWKLSRSVWDKLKVMKPSNEIDRTYRKLYIRGGSFAYGEDTFSPSKEDGGTEMQVAQRGEDLRERLKGVKLHSEDWLAVCKKYDGPNTWHFIDPPYPGDKPGWDKTPEGPTLEELAKGISSLKGKWLLTINNTPDVKAAFSKYHIMRVTMPSRAGTEGTTGKKDSELLIANYELRASEAIDIEDLDVLQEEARHSRTKCMSCDEPPVIDVHWADGRGRAWFCLKHFEAWATEEREIVRAWYLSSGEAPKEIGQGTDTIQVKKSQDGLGPKEIMRRLDHLIAMKEYQSSSTTPSISTTDSWGNFPLSNDFQASISWRLPPFASVGGKYMLAPTILEMLPAHEIYAEPFCGASSVLFSKPAALKEILNDSDPDIAHALNTLQALDFPALTRLSQMNWMPSKMHWHWVESYEPEDDLEAIYQFLYLNWYRYGATGRYRKPKNFNPNTVMERIMQARVRLSRVTITNEDALRCIERWDGPNAVFFIDPPHPDGKLTKAGAANWPPYTEEDFLNLVEAISGMKGKFVMSINSTPERETQLAKFHIRPVTVPSAMQHGSPFEDGQLVRARQELLVTNFQKE